MPAVFGSLEDADRLFETVKSTGLKYMMFETSCFHEDLYAMRQIYNAGGFGKIMHAEGEYLHYLPKMVDSYKGWRDGLPPICYPTHATAYYVGVTGGSFTEVSCQGVRSTFDYLQPENNRYKNPFGTEVALFRTSDGGTARMIVSWDSPGYGGEMGRVRGQKGTYYHDHGHFMGADSNLVNNALRYTLTDGKVIIEPFVSDQSYGLTVKDTGIVILKEDLEKIFEEFYRSKIARETEQIGTGLGLNLVKEIVHHYKGEITVKSEIGKGSEFKVEFLLE